MKTDAEIKTNIINRLSSDARIDASNIDVKVKNGVVTLTGSVLSFTEKTIVGDESWYVSGVIKVNNDLDVEFPLSYTPLTDNEIKDSVNQLLDWNPQVDKENVNVKVSNGIVTLEGSVPSYWQMLEAEKSAAKASSVHDVINKIAVVPTKKISDEIVGESILDRIEQVSPVYVDDINVKVENGNVTLSGSLPSYSLWSSVYSTAQSTFGVVDVIDNISITS